MIPFGFLFVITPLSRSALTATSVLTGSDHRPVYFQRLRGGVIADGVSSLLRQCSIRFQHYFAQNNGVINSRSGSRALVVCRIHSVAMGLFRQWRVVQPCRRQCGRATIIMFGRSQFRDQNLIRNHHGSPRIYHCLQFLSGWFGVTFVPEITQAMPPC